MEPTKITTVAGTGIVVRGNDIDTDRIIPARYLKVVTFDGLGEYAFQDVRKNESGETTDHPFNDPVFASASVLLVNKNFGCGSSREHAPQALMRWGIQAVIGESFAEIFAGNCNALGIPAVCVSETAIGDLMSAVEGNPRSEITIDLSAGAVILSGNSYRIEMPETYRQALTAGTWDSTAQLLANEGAIRATAGKLPYTTNFA